MEQDNRAKYLHGKPKGINDNQRFRLVVRLLREHYPPNRPVQVRRRGKDDSAMNKLYADGYTHLANQGKPTREQYFLIVINKDMGWDRQLDAMMHEWAHAMTWDIPSSQDHNREWAYAYGKLYRMLIED